MTGRVRGVREALSALGLDPEDILSVVFAPSYAEAVDRLEGVKRAAKQHYKAAVLFLHPDRTGNNRKATEFFRLVTELHESLQQAHVGPKWEELVFIPVPPWSLIE